MTGKFLFRSGLVGPNSAEVCARSMELGSACFSSRLVGPNSSEDMSEILRAQESSFPFRVGRSEFV